MSNEFCFIKQKDFVLEKWSLDETTMTSFHIWHMHFGEDSGHEHDESHLIHSMQNFKYRLACFTWNVCIIV